MQSELQQRRWVITVLERCTSPDDRKHPLYDKAFDPIEDNAFRFPLSCHPLIDSTDVRVQTDVDRADRTEISLCRVFNNPAFWLTLVLARRLLV